MKRGWLFLFVAAALLVPTARAQDLLRPADGRLTHRTQFYSSPPGTMAFLPQVRVSDDAKYAGQWDPLVASKRYEVVQSDEYCFVVNHRDRGRAGRSSYVAIGALSVLRPGTELRPVSMFRNQGWSRDGDPTYPRDNDLLKHVALTPETFAGAHGQEKLEKNDQLLTYRWHGYYGDRESWEDRDFWAATASADAGLISSLAGTQVQPDLRFDAKLLRFAFTGERTSNRPVAFCVNGDRRIATVLTVFSPHLSPAVRQFELVFHPRR